jgi:hypothetical protein
MQSPWTSNELRRDILEFPDSGIHGLLAPDKRSLHSVSHDVGMHDLEAPVTVGALLRYGRRSLVVG